MEKLIITCAPTGSLMVPTQSPYLPITPEQIVDEAVRAANAGAAMVHIHARDPEDGKLFHLNLMELWLLHLDPQNLSFNALIRNAEGINRWLVWFRNGDIQIDDHLKMKGGQRFFNP